MRTISAIVCSALSLSFLFSPHIAAARSAGEWGCKVGQCELKSTPPTKTSSQRDCVRNQKNFFVEEIENAVSGPETGSFNLTGSLAHQGSGTQTLDAYYADSATRDYLRDLILTIHVPDSVEGVTVRLLDADGNLLGIQPTADAEMKVLYWSHEFDPVSVVSPTINFEVQGSVAAHADDAGYLDSPMFWFVIRGTRCQAL